MNRDDTIMHIDWWKITIYTDEANRKYNHTRISLSFLSDDGDFIIPIWNTHTSIYDLHKRLVKYLNSHL